MADLSSLSPGMRTRRPSLRPVRMDMTPLVDLAFLLLTFFILTTSLRRLEGMDLVSSLSGTGKVADSTLTFLIGGRDSIFGYAGTFDPARTIPVRYGLDQVRYALRHRPGISSPSILIKPRGNARYADVLGVVDACVTSGITRYSILDHAGEDEWMAAVPPAH